MKREDELVNQIDFMSIMREHIKKPFIICFSLLKKETEDFKIVNKSQYRKGKERLLIENQ